MKKFLKYLALTILGVSVIAYIGFLFILPNAIDLNVFKPEAQKIAKEQANLNIDFENLKIITTPLLGIGVKADNISVKLPDDSTLFSAENLKTRVSIPSLFLLTVKVSCLEVNKPFVNLEIINNENFKVVKLVEDLLNSGKEQKLEEEVQTIQAETEGFQFNPAWIKIKVPCIKLNNYRVLVNDLKSKHYLDLKGEELTLGYFNGKVAKIKTYAELFSDENKNITANVDINTFLPPMEPALDEEDDPAERIEFPFVNPVTMYRNYDLKANLDTKLKIRNRNDNLTSSGHFNVEGITLKVSHLQLPESYIRANMFGSNVNLDTNIYAAKDQNIELLGKINYSKHPKMDLNIKTGTIHFNDMLILGKAFLDSLHIKNELVLIKAEGTINADCYIKTNFKKLKSNGSIIVKNGGVSVRNLGKVLSDANIDVKLDNNILDIRNSSVLVGTSPIYIDGKIDEKSVADINIKANKISLPLLFNAFAPQEIRNAYRFRSADATLDLSIKGELKKAIASIVFGLDNLHLADRANSFILKNSNFAGEFSCDAKSLKGSIKNNGLSAFITATKSQISVPKLNVNIEDNNISIQENKILFNNKSEITYSGEIIDYNKLKSIKLNAHGDLNTDDLIQLIGREFKPYMHSQGSIPVKLTVDGNGKKQTLFIQALADNENFITPVDFKNVLEQNTSLQSVIDFKGNRIKIKKTGLFTRNVSVDEGGNEIVNLGEVVGVDGTIEGDRINLIKITMPKTLEGKIHVFPKSVFSLNGRAFILGKLASPRFRGGFNASNISIPELLLTLKSANIQFKGHEANFDIQDLILNDSDIQTDGIISLLPAPVLNILNLNVSSRYMNVDKAMLVADKAMKYVPQVPAATSSTSAPADIPIIIHNGSINFKKIISGTITVDNTYSRISMARNIFFLRNLRANVFKGNVHGNISMNLTTSLLNIKLSGQGFDVDQMMRDAAAMKDTLSGTAKFNADLSLSGATYEEQMKSMKGTVDFVVKDGQFGPFGKLENLILAENIRESQFFQTALGGIIEGLFTIDTTHFSELIGQLSFNDGICHIEPITSLGNILSLHIFGDFDLLRNYADMKVRARMASLVSNLLGPIGAINPANLINSAASLNVFTAKAFSIFCEMVPEEEIAILPSFSNNYIDKAATKFQIVVRGDVAKPLTLVKSFKWLATATEYDAAVDFVNSLPEPIEGSTATNIEEAIQEAQALEAQKQTVKYKLQHMFEKEENSSTAKPVVPVETEAPVITQEEKAE